MSDELKGRVNVGIGPSNIWTFDERRLPIRKYRGRPGSFAMRAALCSIGPLTYELVQSLQGPNIYEDFLLDGGAGRHPAASSRLLRR
ncbi:MAG: hypothetical protein QOF96_1422 [Actinomycetota bacterium]|jgi:hypothetical protein|nr:hypothetical protein [Actinomycetota bacterium]